MKALDFDLDDDFHVTITRLSDWAYRELGPRVAITTDLWNVISAQDRMGKDALNLAQYYWALRNIFGPSGGYYDDWKCTFSFPLGLEFNKNGISSRYVTNLIDYRAGLEFRLYKLLSEDESRDGDFEIGIYHAPIDEELSEKNFNRFVSFFIGFLADFLKKQPIEPIFFFRYIEAEHVLFGFQDGAYFATWTETEGRYQDSLDELREEAVRQGGRELPPIIEDEKDLFWVCQGYSRFEDQLIRRGQAQILARQLVFRFGTAATGLEKVLEKLSAVQMADLSETVLEAETLNEVVASYQTLLPTDRTDAVTA